METILFIAAIVGLYKLWHADWASSGSPRVKLTAEDYEQLRREREARHRSKVEQDLARARNCWKCGGKGYFPVGNVGMAGCSHNW